jgi:transcriptional regulator with XRE-family HTH domain
MASEHEILLSGDDVRRRRAALGWSQTQLAEAAGCAPNTVNRYEKGHSIPIPAVADAIRRVTDEALAAALVTIRAELGEAS